MAKNLTVLVVEDDPSIARLLELELRHRGMHVHVAGDGLTGLTLHAQHHPDIVVLDILLPAMDGERVLHTLRKEGSKTPVIMLTARDSAYDKVRNFEVGADDYLTKPFDVDELVARMRAVLRRVQPEEIIRIGTLEINLGTRQVFREGESVELTGREYDLLTLLAQNSPQVLTRAQLLDRIWSDRAEVDPNVLDVYIGYLRKKIDLPGRPRLIQTVRGVGYTLRED